MTQRIIDNLPPDYPVVSMMVIFLQTLRIKSIKMVGHVKHRRMINQSNVFSVYLLVI